MNAVPPAAVAAREAIPEIPRLPSGKLRPAVPHACQSSTAVTDVLHETESGRASPLQAEKACFGMTRPTSAKVPPASQPDACQTDEGKRTGLFGLRSLNQLKSHD